jgi:membrane peptidoglycan carboxypeptidase
MPDKKRTPAGALGGLLGLVGLSAVAGVLVTATVTPAIAISGAAASSAITVFDNMPSYLEIDELMQPTTLWWNNKDTGKDEVLAKFYDQNRSPVAFDDVTPVMYDAVLSSEDPRYYQHGGVDLIGTTRALLSNAQGGATQGGSSISQQYVKNVLIQRCEREARQTDTQSREEVLQGCWLEATNSSGVEGYQRKLQEMRYAIQLEKEYSKNEILLGYLNIANFGGTTYGIDAAAKYYFNVSASELSLSQAATLAGIVQNPNTYRIDKRDGSTTDADGNLVNSEADGYAVTKKRQTYVLDRMLDDGKITQEQHDTAVAEPIVPQITPAQSGCESAGAAAYFCAYVVSVIQNDVAFGDSQDERTRALRQDGLNVYVTLDNRLQYSAEQAMSAYAPSSVENMQFGSTAVSLEAGTGRVLALAQNTRYTPGDNGGDTSLSSIVYAGNRQFGASDGFNAGSTFKLFTLVDWLEQGHSLREVVNGRDRNVPNMTNSCYGNYVNTSGDRIRNFGNQSGFSGTPLQFTAMSLNTGYLGMAAELDLCDIANVAKKMGVTLGTGEDIKMLYGNNVIGSDAVSPLAMAGAYATVANGGNYCQPKVIDRVTDSNGQDRPELVPERGCSQALTPEVAATAAFALQGVMASGGTGARANPGDGTPLLGKTGTHETYQSWMIESSSNVTTTVWAGNSTGTVGIDQRYYNGRRLMDVRYPIAQDIQRTADRLYGGNPFPQPDNNLTRQVLRDLPDVVGQTLEQAKSTLQAAGFSSIVGEPVDSDRPTDVVAQQDPGAGRVASGTTVTLRPSNGQGATVPPVAGSSVPAAMSTLQASGFTNLSGSCTEDSNAPKDGLVSGTNPGAGTVTGKGAAIAISYTAKDC